MNPHAAVAAFRRGELDEAPVPQGEIRALAADPVLSSTLRVRTLNGVDAIQFERTVPADVLRAYDRTAPRADYQALISERVAPAAYGLRRDAKPVTAAQFRAARASIRRLPPIPIALHVGDEPELVEAAEIVWAEWRQLGLPISLAHEVIGREARLVRMVPPRLETRNVVALAWLAEARLVSPRVRGWKMDELGVVDYANVTLEPGA